MTFPEIRKNLRLFILFSSYSLKTIFQGRLGIVFFMAGKILRFIMLFALILIVFSQTRLIKGYSLDQVIVFYLTYNIIDTASQILFREVYRFRPLVLSGSFDLVLIKPYHPFLRILIGGIDFLDLILLLPYVATVIFFLVKMQISFQLSVFYFLLIANSLLIATAFHIVVLALGILTTEVDHTIMIYRDLTHLGRFPINIYREPIRSFFTFVIPVGVMMSLPVQTIFAARLSIIHLAAILISLLLFAFSLWLWQTALKKYQSWGG